MSGKKVKSTRSDAPYQTAQICRYLADSVRFELFGRRPAYSSVFTTLSKIPYKLRRRHPLYPRVFRHPNLSTLPPQDRHFAIGSFLDQKRLFRHLPRTKPSRSPPALPQWKHASKELKLLCACISFTDTTSYGFSLNLGSKIQSQALSEADMQGWLYRRVARHLKLKLGRKPKFFVMWERNRSGAYHMHGQVATSEHELEITRAALKAAAGEWGGSATEHQLDMRRDPDLGWAGYSAKGFRYGHEPSMSWERTRDAKEVLGQLREAWA